MEQTSPGLTPASASDHPTENNWAGPFKALSTILQTFNKNLAPLGVFAAIYTALAIASLVIYQSDPLSMIRAAFSANTTPESSPFDFVPFIVSLLLIVPETKMALALADNRAATIKEIFIFKPAHLFWAVISWLIIIPAVFFGALLFLVPLIWLLPWFSMVLFAVVDKNNSALNAIRTSYHLTEQHLGKVWGVIGLTALINIVAFALFFIPVAGEAVGSVANLLAYGVLALLYRWLTTNYKPKESPAADTDGSAAA